jgi:ferric-chelate reductase
MDMSMPMGGVSAGGSSTVALNDSGVDFSNETQAFNFLGEILDDSQFQIDGNRYARYFWYGTVVVIAIAGIFNAVQRLILKQR